jgi:hypothetical protein
MKPAAAMLMSSSSFSSSSLSLKRHIMFSLNRSCPLYVHRAKWKVTRLENFCILSDMCGQQFSVLFLFCFNFVSVLFLFCFCQFSVDPS